MLQAVIEQDEKKIQQQICALKWQLEQDIPEKDKEIFKRTVFELEGAKNNLEGGAC